MEIDLSYEVDIRWVKPEAKKLRYVREMIITTGGRIGINIKKYYKNIVAYSILRPHRPDSDIKGRYLHRVWYVAGGLLIELPSRTLNWF